MLHRRVNPRVLTPNPTNPRSFAAGKEADKQLIASIRETGGPVQPPVVRVLDDGVLQIVAGHRRVAASVAAGLAEIDVFVREAESTGDSMAAFAENVVRSNMSSVDMWRAVEALIGEGYTEDGVATALAIPARVVRRLRVFTTILPAMLNRMGQGDEPTEKQLHVIAAATQDEQAAVWKRNKPKKTERADWSDIAHALRKQRIGYEAAAFDDAHAAAHGVIWTDDLFAEGGKEARFTDQVDVFAAAQEAWMIDHLPENGEVLTVNEWGAVQLPPKCERAWGTAEKRKDVRLGFYLDPNSLAIRQISFLPSTPAERVVDKATGAVAKAPRPDISNPGHELIGVYRTQALHQALAEGEISDEHLLGMLILALDGRNVSVERDHRDYRTGSTDRGCFARAVAEGGVLTTDLPTLRDAARGMLQAVLSCKTGAEGSGRVARIAGASIHAETYLPNMATEDFLPKLSKDGITKVLQSENLLPRSTGKLMRAALTEHVGSGSWVHPDALFALSGAELTALNEQIARDRDPDVTEDDGVEAEDEDPTDEDDGDEPIDDVPGDEDAVIAAQMLAPATEVTGDHAP